MSSLKSHVCIAAAIVWMVAAPVRAAEWFVAPGGTGSGTSGAPFGRVQDGLNAAGPGDTVTLRPGTYRESIRTVRHGAAGSPIRVRAEQQRGSVVITVAGKVLQVDHAYIEVEGLVLDGQYAAADTVDVGTECATFLVLRNLEVRRSSKDLIDIGSPQNVLIEDCLIHHALNAANGRTDAHGIVAGAVRNLTIRDTEIHTFSGDGFQVDPGRLGAGMDERDGRRVPHLARAAACAGERFRRRRGSWRERHRHEGVEQPAAGDADDPRHDRLGIPRRADFEHGRLQPEGERERDRRPGDRVRLGNRVPAPRPRLRDRLAARGSPSRTRSSTTSTSGSATKTTSRI